MKKGYKTFFLERIKNLYKFHSTYWSAASEFSIKCSFLQHFLMQKDIELQFIAPKYFINKFSTLYYIYNWNVSILLLHPHSPRQDPSTRRMVGFLLVKPQSGRASSVRARERTRGRSDGCACGRASAHAGGRTGDWQPLDRIILPPLFIYKDLNII